MLFNLREKARIHEFTTLTTYNGLALQDSAPAAGLVTGTTATSQGMPK